MSFRRFASASALLFGLVSSSGCAEATDESRATMALPSDGYLSFRAHHPHADGMPGVLVELRNAPPGAYVLVYAPRRPSDVGWFELSPDAFAGCTARERTPGVSNVACVLPHGRGEVVDIAFVDAPTLLPTSEGTAPEPRSSNVLGTSAILRHVDCVTRACASGWPNGAKRGALSSRGSDESSSPPPAPTWTGYYGVLRVTPDGDAIDVVVEGLSLEDEHDTEEMRIERL